MPQWAAGTSKKRSVSGSAQLIFSGRGGDVQESSDRFTKQAVLKDLEPPKRAGIICRSTLADDVECAKQWLLPQRPVSMS